MGEVRFTYFHDVTELGSLPQKLSKRETRAPGAMLRTPWDPHRGLTPTH